jgi:hypothetical protein
MYKYLLLSGLFLGATLPAYASPVIGNLEGYAPAKASSCGLFLKNPKGELAFYADTSFNAFVNSGGVVVKLSHVKTENHQQATGRVQSGDTFLTTFASEGTEVKLDIKVVKGCEATGSSVCPAVTETGTLQLSTAAGKSVLPVTGGEHCADRN